MTVLIVFAFLAGIVTVLSPCILPVLPIILSSSVDSGGKRRPIGVVTGFILSFTFFTLFLSAIVRLSGIPAETFRYMSVFILIMFGLTLLIPHFQKLTEQLFSKLSRFVPQSQSKTGFWGGLIIGLSLGLLWTPCVGPILASVISLALTGSVTGQAFLIILAYSIGTAIPMFIIIQTGSSALQKVPWLIRNTGNIQKAFGILMILTAFAIFLNFDRKFQTYILTAFPNYGVGLTKIEDNPAVRSQLENIGQPPLSDIQIGQPMPSPNSTLPKGPKAPEIIAGGEWFNSEPLKLSDLKGKVVVIDFWTYSCINCQRTFPYLRDWWGKYEDKGLVIVGVHSPEFEFEKDNKNVAKAIKDFQLAYPIVQDNNFETWRAYNNHYWPAKYFIDKDGYIRYVHFGEGAYDESERVIQELLAEAGATDVSQSISNPDYQVYANTPETYLGYGRIQNFASNEKIAMDKVAAYSAPNNLSNNKFAYTGNWEITSESANPKAGAKLLFNFDSKEVFLVMTNKGESAKVKVYIDGKLQYFGEDNIDGTVTVDSDRLYKLINLPNPGKHILQLEFEDDNAVLYAFTFG